MDEANRPADWKHFDDFAAGIATNRLPTTSALAGRTLKIKLKDGRVVELSFPAADKVAWKEAGHSGEDWCEAIEVAPHTFFIDITYASRPQHAMTVIANTRTRRVLAVRSRIREAAEAGAEPRVAQDFHAGTLGSDSALASGTAPHPTRDLIGLRTWQVYSPEHTYEHTYLSSERYAWQCLVGVQRGQGDVDMASYWKFDDGQYLFTFREFLIPVASVFFFNFESGRSTGKFLGVTGAGQVANNPAGAFMRKASMTFYPAEFGPV